MVEVILEAAAKLLVNLYLVDEKNWRTLLVKFCDYSTMLDIRLMLESFESFDLFVQGINPYLSMDIETNPQNSANQTFQMIFKIADLISLTASLNKELVNQLILKV